MATSKRFKRSLHGNNSIITEAKRLVQKLGNQIPNIRITPLPKKQEDIDPEKISSPVDLTREGNLLTCKVTTPNCSQTLRIVSDDHRLVTELCLNYNEQMLAKLEARLES